VRAEHALAAAGAWERVGHIAEEPLITALFWGGRDRPACDGEAAGPDKPGIAGKWHI